jgi:magnesium-transporting ATPase (P-type)
MNIQVGSEWTNYAMGAVSLFPLSGSIAKLKGFFPNKLRMWYITFSTIFSLFIYFYVQWFFEDIANILYFIPVWKSWLMAIFFVILYVGIIIKWMPKYAKMTPSRKSTFIIVTMVVYLIVIGSLTYTFNVLENFKDYKIINGKIMLNGRDLKAAAIIKIVIAGKGENFNTFQNGKFLIIVNNTKYSNITTITPTVYMRGIPYSKTLMIDELSTNKPWIININ